MNRSKRKEGKMVGEHTTVFFSHFFRLYVSIYIFFVAGIEEMLFVYYVLFSLYSSNLEMSTI